MSIATLFTARQYEAICAGLPDPAFILTESGRYAAILGGRDKRYYHDGSSLVGKNLFDVLAPQKAQWFLRQILKTLAAKQMLIVEYELSVHDVLGLTSDGPAEPIWFEGRISALEGEYMGEPAVVWVASNITEGKRLERRLQHQALTDELTGLYNRRRFMQDLAAAFEAFGHHGQPSCLIAFDVDHFKSINDSLGHPVGDQALCGLAREIQKIARPGDVFCRLGGDEFALLCASSPMPPVLPFAEHIRHVGGDVLVVYAGEGARPSLSIGIAAFEAADTTVEDILHRADRALYASKLGGGDRVTHSVGSGQGMALHP